MKNIITIFNREIKAYFNSAIAYIFIVVFLLISAGLFMTQFFLISTADMRAFFYLLPISLCVFLPAVTMRLWAEDRRGNTLELLLTFPVETREIVLGKFLASLLFFIIVLLSTVTIPIMIAFLGKPDHAVIICQYVGAILLGSFFLALGIFVSGFCKDQIVSFILAMMAGFGFFLLGADFTVSSIDGWIPGLGSFLRNSLGMTQHFDAFQKGVIDTRDVLYFVIGTAVFLVLNGFWLETRLRPKAKSIFTTTCLISIGIFILFNFIFSDVPIGRFDCTEGKIYTISDATRQILQELEAPATAKLFISPSDKMPTEMKMLERDIRDKLDEFKVSAKGNFNYKVFHMEPANVEGGPREDDLEKSIESKGIRPFQVSSIEADELGVKLVYSAMSLAYKEKPEEILPTITPQDLSGLEYELISKIYRMTLDKTPSVALVAPYIEKPIDPNMAQVLKMLGQQAAKEYKEDNYELVEKVLRYEGYDVSRIRLTKDETIPEGIGTLVIIEPERLNERQQFELNRFLVNGGSVFLAVQRYEFMYETFGPNGVRVNAIDNEPKVDSLLEKWGLGVSSDFLMDSQMEVVSLQGENLFGLFPVSSPVKLPMQLRVVPEQMNRKVSITSNLPLIFYLWGNAIDIDSAKLKELNLTSEVLFTSSPDAWSVTYHYGEITKDDITMPAPAKRKTFTLAALVQGQFPDAFKDKEVPEWPKEEEETQGASGEESYEKPKEKIELYPKPGKLIILGCARMFAKELFTKGGHLPFLLNSIDAITLGEKLIRVRSKQPVDRALRKVSSSAKAGWRIFTVFFVPALLSIIGTLKVFMRRRSKWVYLKSV